MISMIRKRVSPLPSVPRRRKASAKRIVRPAENGKAQSTIERIFAGARQVIVKHGYAGFTTRRVAEAACIAPGNLSYHFPSKQDLIQALIRHLLPDYLAQLETFVSDPMLPSEQEIARLMRWAMIDAVSSDVVHVFRELWIIALRDAASRQKVHEYYDEVMDRVVRLLRRLRPTVDARVIRELVQVWAIIAEGSNVLYGTGAQRAVPYERIIEITLALPQYLAPELHLDLTASRDSTQTAQQKLT
jgi:AcrR family transcriptional regulator